MEIVLMLVMIFIMVYYFTGVLKKIGQLERKIEKMSQPSQGKNEARGTSFQEPESMPHAQPAVASSAVAFEPREEVDVNPLHFVDHTTEERVSPRTIHESRSDFHAQESLEPTVIDRFGMWLRHDWPLKVGGILIILAVGFFVSYATERGFLNEIARVFLGYLFGAGALFYGIFRADKVRVQGNVFLIIGIAAVFIATLAAVSFETVQMPASLALVVMLMTVAFVSFVSLRQKSVALTASMIGFGALIPLFFFDGLSTENIFLYLFVLTLGTLWIVALSGWRELSVLMLGAVGFYSIGFAVTEYGDVAQWGYMILALLFAAVFYLTSVFTIVKQKELTQSDIVFAVGTTVLYLIWTYLFGPEEFRVLLLLLGAVLFTVASYVIFSVTSVKMPTIVYGASACILIAVATAEIFGGAVLTIAYLLELTVVITLLLYALGERFDQSKQMLSVILFCGPLFLLLGSISILVDRTLSSKGGYFGLGTSMSGSIVSHLFAVFVAIVCTGLIAFVARRSLPRKEGTFHLVFLAASMILAVAFVWFATHLNMTYALATFVSLFVYMAVGIVFYVYGAQIRSSAHQIIGSLFFGLVLVRIFVVEFWQMEIGMRIITFFVVGALFIIAAYIARSRAGKQISS